jgi:hypothetical protein
MAAHGALIRQLLEREARIWLDLAPAKYDRALCGMVDDISGAPDSAERIDALLALTSSTLRRKSQTLTESRVRCAERLLALVPAISEPAVRMHVYLLVLLAWFQLGAVAARGPESIPVTPALPKGVVLPDGMDAAEIADPALREQARKAAECHSETVERWNAKQRALGHLHLLAALVRAAHHDFTDDEGVVKELAAVMSLAPRLPPSLRQLLEDAAK